ncbi:MAG: hypothetical protein ACI9MR_000027 [Myxococcota bacterium]|jgi:hypothetical protein
MTKDERLNALYRLPFVRGGPWRQFVFDADGVMAFTLGPGDFGGWVARWAEIGCQVMGMAARQGTEGLAHTCNKRVFEACREMAGMCEDPEGPSRDEFITALNATWVR